MCPTKQPQFALVIYWHAFRQWHICPFFLVHNVLLPFMLRARLPLARNILLHFRFIQHFLMHNRSLHASLPSLCFLHFSIVMADLAFLNFVNNNTMLDVSNLGQKPWLRLLNSVASTHGRLSRMVLMRERRWPWRHRNCRTTWIYWRYHTWKKFLSLTRRTLCTSSSLASLPCNKEPSIFLLFNENTLIKFCLGILNKISKRSANTKKLEFHFRHHETHTPLGTTLASTLSLAHQTSPTRNPFSKHNWKRTPPNNYKLLFAHNGASLWASNCTCATPETFSSTVHLCTLFASPRTFFTLLSQHHKRQAKWWWTLLSTISQRGLQCSTLQTSNIKLNSALVLGRLGRTRIIFTLQLQSSHVQFLDHLALSYRNNTFVLWKSFVKTKKSVVWMSHECWIPFSCQPTSSVVAGLILLVSLVELSLMLAILFTSSNLSPLISLLPSRAISLSNTQHN